MHSSLKEVLIEELGAKPSREIAYREKHHTVSILKSFKAIVEKNKDQACLSRKERKEAVIHVEQTNSKPARLGVRCNNGGDGRLSA